MTPAGAEPVAWIESLRAARLDARLWWEHGRRGARPRRLIDLEPDCGGSYDRWLWRLRSAVPEYIEERRRAVERAGLVRDAVVSANTGKLLVFNVLTTITDGLSAGETDGLLDVFDCPVVDFWIGFLSASAGEFPEGGDLLVSWIPDEHVEAVSSAIGVNCTACIGWADSNEARGTPLGHWLAQV